MTVLNELDRFHLAIDGVRRVPTTGDGGLKLQRLLEDKLLQHRLYINQNGQDMPEIRDWMWVQTGV